MSDDDDAAAIVKDDTGTPQEIENAISKHQETISEHEKAIADAKEHINRLKLKHSDMDHDTRVRQRESETKRWFDMLADLEAWRTWVARYDATYFRATVEYLRAYEFSNEDLHMASEYAHLSEPELVAVFTFARDHGMRVNMGKDDAVPEFEFVGNWTTIRPIDTAFQALQKRLSSRLATSSGYVGDEHWLHVWPVKAGPSLGYFSVMAFRQMTRQLKK